MAFETKVLLIRMPLSLHQWLFDIAARTGESAASITRTALRSELQRCEEESQCLKGHTNTGYAAYETAIMRNLAATRAYLDNEEAGNAVPRPMGSRPENCTREDPCCDEPQIILRKSLTACTCLCHE